MRYGFLAILLLLTVIFQMLWPVYEFYAHRHAVPRLGADYVALPNSDTDPAPQNQKVYVSAYQGVTETVLTTLERHRQAIRSPGISAAVAIDGELVWAGTSGWANIKDNRPLTVESQFRIGSTSKALTATLLATMVDAEQLSLDTPLAQFQVGQLNASWQAITPRQLASHMSGIPHYNGNSDWRGLLRTMALDSHYQDVADSVLLFDGSDLLFAPGESFEYSSLGTVLLSAVMQEALGETYQQAMQGRVFSQLGMQHTRAEPDMASRNSETANLVTFYWHPNDQSNQVAPWRDVDLSHRLAGGGYISTSSDLVKLGLGFNSPHFISQQTRDAFWIPQTLNNGQVNPQKYAIGWRVRESDFGDEIGTLFHANHGGVSRGAQSWLMVIPQYNMAVAVNINAKTDPFWDFGKVSFELVRLFLIHRHTLLSS